MVSHCTYAIAVLPLHMSFTVKIKLTTGLCNMRLEGQEYIQGAKKNNREDPTAKEMIRLAT